MWIVRLALRRPYTFIVLAMLIVLFGVFGILRTPTISFRTSTFRSSAPSGPTPGCRPKTWPIASSPMPSATRRPRSTMLSIPNHSRCRHGGGQVFFQPNVNEELAYAQITGVSQTLLRQALRHDPPFILAYNASTVPILQLALSSATLSESQIFDMANTIVRRGWRPSRSLAAIPVRRQAAPIRSTSIRRRCAPRARRRRRQQRHRRAKPHYPAGTEKIAISNTTSNSTQPLKASDLNDIPSATSTARSCSCATSPMCMMAAVRRPTSCGSMAGMPC